MMGPREAQALLGFISLSFLIDFLVFILGLVGGPLYNGARYTDHNSTKVGAQPIIVAFRVEISPVLVVVNW